MFLKTYSVIIIFNTLERSNILKMFSADIQKIEQDLEIYKFKAFNKQQNQCIDLQYQIYSKYIRISSQQITIKQLTIINQTSNLLSNLASINSFSEKDSSTLDSLTYDDQIDSSMINDFSIIERSKKRITRKGMRGLNCSTLYKSTDAMNQALKQIEDQCSEKSYLLIKNIIEQQKKISLRLIQLQKKQKIAKKQQQKIQKLEQQSLLLKQKLYQAQIKLAQKQKQIEIFKLQKSMKSLQNSRISSNFGSEFSVGSQKKIIESSKKDKFKTMVTFLQEKQEKLYLRMKKVSQIQISIEDKIEKSIILKQNKQNESCQRCCNMIKKIKQSVINYRNYLEQQSEQVQKMYQKYKESLKTSQFNDLV